MGGGWRRSSAKYIVRWIKGTTQLYLLQNGHPVTVLTFTMSCLLPSRHSHWLRRFSTLSNNPKSTNLRRYAQDYSKIVIGKTNPTTKRFHTTTSVNQVQARIHCYPLSPSQRERERERERERVREGETETYKTHRRVVCLRRCLLQDQSLPTSTRLSPNLDSDRAISVQNIVVDSEVSSDRTVHTGHNVSTECVVWKSQLHDPGRPDALRNWCSGDCCLVFFNTT